jgi:hypothetical protein
LNEEVITLLIIKFIHNKLPSLETFKSYYDRLEVYKKPLIQPPMRTMKTPTIMNKKETARRRLPFSPQPYSIRTGGRRTQKKRKMRSQSRKNKNYGKQAQT